MALVPPQDPDEAMLTALREAVSRDPDIAACDLVAILKRRGALTRFVQRTSNGGFRYVGPWRDVLRCLSGVGGVDLSMARLLEGHLNALQLIALYGTSDQQASAWMEAENGGLLGVWGADAPVRTQIVGALPGERSLTGAKRYASGLGTIRTALVPVFPPEGPSELLFLRVDEPARADASSWNHRGMRRTVSGTYDLEGLAVRPENVVGEPGDYQREPFFVGGIWRCAAAQLGALEAIVAAIGHDLAASGRDAHPLQMARLGTAILHARTARLWVEDAAAQVEGCSPNAGEDETRRIVALSAYCRLATEQAAMHIIEIAERGIGLASFACGHPVEALTRDLSVYIRQANPDAVLLQHGRVLARDL